MPTTNFIINLLYLKAININFSNSKCFYESINIMIITRTLKTSYNLSKICSYRYVFSLYEYNKPTFT